MPFVIYSHKTGECWNKNFNRGSCPRIVWVKQDMSNFDSDYLKKVIVFRINQRCSFDFDIFGQPNGCSIPEKNSIPIFRGDERSRLDQKCTLCVRCFSIKDRTLHSNFQTMLLFARILFLVTIFVKNGPYLGK